MFRGYNLTLGDIDFSDYVDEGRNIHEQNKESVRTKLESFQDENGQLVASEIIANWFPPVKVNVFLSHSHKDEATVIGLAGFLHEELGLTSFIDSCIWGYSAELLRLIDEEYCYQPSRNTYSYDKRNRSTSHVHMMLSTALSKMIYSSECIMFVNTPHSISPQEYITSGGTTDSPWIYTEISMTTLVQKRSPLEHRGLSKSARTLDSLTEDFRVTYDVDLRHLTDLNGEDLVVWSGCNARGVAALDALYKRKG
jgi:hypothetical protein